jgi:hypothetical protein
VIVNRWADLWIDADASNDTLNRSNHHAGNIAIAKPRKSTQAPLGGRIGK